uniref:Rho termination factor-like N-terminal domain-containing protein n=1 Tax=viral metagenome TaxID=1070528 RepID=A0A6C0E758_9ZZZZ
MSFELTSPAILLCLGMIVVVAALLVVYFESRMREQNHRLKTMLSLITTLAEDTNSLKHRQAKSFYTNETSLEDERIEVSDGEDDDEDDSEIVDLDDLEDESDSETESKVELDSESDEDEDDSEIECEEVVNSDEEDESNIKVLKLNAPIEGVLSDNVEDQMISSELTDELDYKQMPVAKLRQIATEKGIENAIKLKKPDLLKILL